MSECCTTCAPAPPPSKRAGYLRFVLLAVGAVTLAAALVATWFDYPQTAAGLSLAATLAAG